MKTSPITGATQVYGILGHPVAHSFSPVMQNVAFRSRKMDAVYVAYDVAPSQLEKAIDGIRALNIQGLNITVPHKAAVLDYLDEVTPTAKKIGAVNTIKQEQGRLIGTNTDGLGFLQSLQEMQFTPKDQCIALLGAGGSARSILVSLAEAFVQRILIVNRTPEKAKQLMVEFAPLFPQTKIEAVPMDQMKSESIDLLINTTTVGMKEVATPVPLEECRQVRCVVDIIYSPRETLLLKQARLRGLPFINGIGMLLCQGGAAFEFWTGRPAPLEQMRSALIQHLAEA